jgi:uncharacterized membrane protein YphA (DoxX/SURF4 family)
MPRPGGVLFYIAAVIYPVLVFCSLVVLKIPLRVFSFLLILFSLVYFLAATSKKKI